MPSVQWYLPQTSTTLTQNETTAVTSQQSGFQQIQCFSDTRHPSVCFSVSLVSGHRAQGLYTDTQTWIHSTLFCWFCKNQDWVFGVNCHLKSFLKSKHSNNLIKTSLAFCPGMTQIYRKLFTERFICLFVFCPCLNIVGHKTMKVRHANKRKHIISCLPLSFLDQGQVCQGKTLTVIYLRQRTRRWNIITAIIPARDFLG